MKAVFLMLVASVGLSAFEGIAGNVQGGAAWPVALLIGLALSLSVYGHVKFYSKSQAGTEKAEHHAPGELKDMPASKPFVPPPSIPPKPTDSEQV